MELNDEAFRHLEKAEVVLTFKDIKMEDGTNVRTIPVSKRTMKYKAQYSFELNTTKA